MRRKLQPEDEVYYLNPTNPKKFRIRGTLIEFIGKKTDLWKMQYFDGRGVLRWKVVAAVNLRHCDDEEGLSA